jgi:subtilase family serine protease
VPFALALGASLALAGCGGGSGADAAPDAATFSTTVEAAALPDDAGAELAQPTFHVAPVLLAEPADTDAGDNAASALAAPHAQDVSADEVALGTERMTVQALQARTRARALSTSGGSVAPAAATATAVTYTPAQIRAAYALPALPAANLTPTALQAAQQGAGQTIYIVDAMHDPNVAAELAAFNSKFGLPACTVKTIATSTALPLAAAKAADGCTLSVVYSTPSGGMTTTTPAYDASWATEIALDVQWAHATAPRARIVLIETADASLNSLLGGIKLANAIGPGAVSMSFGGNEGNWTAQVDAAFAGTGMTYLAATGDSGSGVSWPAVSTRVLAVGGTTLTYRGTSARSETAWSLGGGGISGYTATPSYQSNQVPGLGTLARRAVADVAFNANPYSGQYVAVKPQGSSAINWISAGGTSLSTPQWAGLVAVANALRAQSSKTVLGAPHAALYTQIAQAPGTYSASFADVTTGANGSCSTCAAKTGYDVPTGLGTPNASALLTALGSATATTPTTTQTVASPPVITAPAVTGIAGKALTGTVTVASPSGAAVAVQISGIPSGMKFSASGQSLVMNWAKPVTGKYNLSITAKDSAGLTTSVTWSVTINAK